MHRIGSDPWSLDPMVSRFIEVDAEVEAPTLFMERLGQYPHRIKNLYFTFLFLLRAVSKAAPAFD